MSPTRAVLTAALSIAFLSACEQKSPPPPAPSPAPASPSETPPPAPADATPTSSIPGNVGDAARSASNAAQDAKSRLIRSLESGVETARTQLAELRAKASAAAEERKPEMQAALDKAQAQFDELTQDLAELKADAGVQWDKLSAKAKSSYESLKSSLADYTAKYR